MTVWLSLGALLLGCRATPPEPANPDQPVPEEVPSFIYPEEAAIFIGHPDVRIVDARPGRQYRRSHVPGAVALEWTELKERGGGLMTGRLDDDAQFLADIVGARGIGPQHWVIVVGDPLELWGEEARIAWVLRYLGHEKVSLLDGGMSAWVAAGFDVQRGALTMPPETYTAEINPDVLARKGDVKDFSDRSDEWRTVIVDVRTTEEFRGGRGAPKYGAPRSGRVPGAIHLPWQVLLDEHGQLRDREKLRELLIPRGVRPDAEIITYCTGGVRSAHTWYVLDSLGYPAVRNYAGSWWEWSVDRRLPVKNGPPEPLPYRLPPFPLNAVVEPEAEPTPPPPLAPGNRYGNVPDWLKGPEDILPAEEPSDPAPSPDEPPVQDAPAPKAAEVE
jgi:thiosulfate/3-mercaptopyruvate sulfurtransferase